MLSLVFMGIGVVLGIVFIVLMFLGSKYDNWLQPLDSFEFPLKSIYSDGIMLQKIPAFSLNGGIGEKLKLASRLLYGDRFMEFYARIFLAQALSFAHLLLAVFFIFAGIVGEKNYIYCVLGGVLFAAIFAVYFIIHPTQVVTDRTAACEKEFPNAISKLALIFNTGMILHESWFTVAYGKDGVFYDLMKESCEEMKNGQSDIAAIFNFGTKTNSEDIKKFVAALIQSIVNGDSRTLSTFLETQSNEIWEHRRQVVLQKGEKAAGELLAPIALMFIGIILIIMAAAMQSFTTF